MRGESGRSSFDVRHRFSLSYSYDLPFGKGKSLLGNAGIATTLLTGWQTYGVITLQTGRPFTVALLPEFDNSNTGISNLGFGQRPPESGGGSEALQSHAGTLVQHRRFCVSAFRQFRQLGQEYSGWAGFQNVNFSMVKNTSINENATIAIPHGVLQSVQSSELRFAG